MTPTPAILIFQIILLFVLILLNAFFAMSEIAIISLNDTKIAKMAEEGNKKAKQVLKLTADSSGFLSTIQIGVTLAGFLTSASASQTFVNMLSGAIGKISFLERYSRRRYQRLFRRCHYAHNIVFFAWS